MRIDEDKDWDSIDYDNDVVAREAFEKACARSDKPDPTILHETECGSTDATGAHTTWVYLRRACVVCGHVECPCCPAGYCDTWPCMNVDHECSYAIPPVSDLGAAVCRACGESRPSDENEGKFDSLGMPLHTCTRRRA